MAKDKPGLLRTELLFSPYRLFIFFTNFFNFFASGSYVVGIQMIKSG